MLTDSEQVIFDQCRPLVTTLVYKFRYMCGHKQAENGWRHYLGMESLGLELSDVYQIAYEELIKIIKKLNLDKISNLKSYIFLGLYRQVRYRLRQYPHYTNIDIVYDIHGEPKTGENSDAQELASIVKEFTNTLSERKQYIFKSLYGLDGFGIKSMAEIGRELGITYQGVQSAQKVIWKQMQKDEKLMEQLRYYYDYSTS